MAKKEIYTVVGFSKGTTKKGDKFTKVALEFESPYRDFVGKDVVSHFIYDDIDVYEGMEVELEYGCRADKKAYVRNIIPVA